MKLSLFIYLFITTTISISISFCTILMYHTQWSLGLAIFNIFLYGIYLFLFASESEEYTKS